MAHKRGAARKRTSAFVKAGRASQQTVQDLRVTQEALRPWKTQRHEDLCDVYPTPSELSHGSLYRTSSKASQSSGSRVLRAIGEERKGGRRGGASAANQKRAAQMRFRPASSRAAPRRPPHDVQSSRRQPRPRRSDIHCPPTRTWPSPSAPTRRRLASAGLASAPGVA